MAAAALERAYGVTNIRSHIPITLDLDEHNYDAWRELSLTHCLSFDVLGHLDGSSLPTGTDDIAWKKRDGIVKLWLYGTLSPNLFRGAFKTDSTSRQIWLRIENQFRNNKEARAIQLDSELRTKEIGDLKVSEYCQEMKILADSLANVDAPVADRTLVMYVLNGLNAKFDNIINVIKHRQPFPTFDDARSMLQDEENRLKRGVKPNPHLTDHSSSGTVLVASHDNLSSGAPRSSNQQSYSGQNRGRGRNNSRGRGRGRNSFPTTPSYSPWGPPQWPAPFPLWTPPQYSQWPYPYPPYPHGAGLLGSRPVIGGTNNTNHSSSGRGTTYEATTDLAHAFNTMTLKDPMDNQWYMDSGATSHLTATTSGTNFQPAFNSNIGNSVIVGNGTRIPITSSGSLNLISHPRPLSLKHVLVTPDIIKNLISVRRFTRDNACSIEFDPFGFSVKDLNTKQILLRSDSTGDLYPVFPRATHTQVSPSVFLVPSSELWHQRLAHPSNATLNSLLSTSQIPCTNKKLPASCNVCQLGKHIKFPFHLSNSVVSAPFDIIHSDLWTSPILSLSGIKYYVLFLDHYSHFVWVYPLRKKSDVFEKFVQFSTYVKTQFNKDIKALHCDNGGEYNNHQFHDFFSTKGMVFRFSCPHTSQQNGRSERMIRTLNNAVRTLLFQANLPPTFWVEALNSAAHILNLLPSSSINGHIPFQKLFHKPPSYAHLRVFGSLCYPNITHSTHKLEPRSTPCIFLGYPLLHRGYRCYDLKTKRIIISRHVTFDETTFPYKVLDRQHPSAYTFLEPEPDSSPILRDILLAPPPVPPAPVAEPPTTNTLSVQTLAHNPAPPQTSHPMATRSKSGIHKKRHILSLHTTSISPLPKGHNQALADPNWYPAMTDEYDACIKYKTWKLVPKPAGTNVVSSMWLYKHKLHADGSLGRYKARLVANGKSQEHGVDFDETFSPVVKPATIRLVLKFGVERNWPIHHLDVKNAFLHGNLDETIYMAQPPGFVDQDHPDFVCLLEKPLYGLKQAPRSWNARFTSVISTMGFIQSKTDTSLFVYHKGTALAYLLLYVDDILLTASTPALFQSINSALRNEFPMTDLGPVSCFLGVAMTFNDHGVFLCQEHYAEEILAKAHMQDCKPCTTPVDLKSKLAIDAGPPVADPTLYRRLAGALQYLTLSRPDISYAVQQICLFMHDPRTAHFHALKRILRYVQGTKHHGLQLHKSTSHQLTAYSDADWAGCPTTRRSTSGYCVFLGDTLISWSSKRQETVSRSSAESEYKGVANAVSETCWLRNLLLDLRCPLSKATIVFCDNISAVYLSSNPVKHQRTKHVEIDIHFVREKVAKGEVRVFHIPASSQYADIFTKGLPSTLFIAFKSSLGVIPRPTLRLREGIK